MKYLLSFIITFLLVLFLSSSILIDTPWFSDNLLNFGSENNFPIFIVLQNIQFFTFLFLTTFVISYIHYSRKVYGNSIKKNVMFYMGTFFGIIIVLNLLQTYYSIVSSEETLKEMKYSSNSYLKGKLTISDAMEIYAKNNILIDYYDYNNTIQKFKPTKQDMEYQKNVQWLQFKKNIIPLKIVFSFFVFITIFSLGNYLANKKHNKSLK
ncbi:hypothetical protein [Poseidonibacter lekithochrous]|uniref:hypothetical protein n=1 Tax=Poseidonibacter lekithochrous TaxID=1904463 RepID=UPI0008FC2C7B|nr:hypothetical protein [Poseidonibacter lekithochrous]QKJ24378.1 putative membrane protein [Poseidonibacter lekithochrous]